MSRVPVQKIVPVDATGAGDQFAAGFLYGFSTVNRLRLLAAWGAPPPPK